MSNFIPGKLYMIATFSYPNSIGRYFKHSQLGSDSVCFVEIKNDDKIIAMYVKPEGNPKYQQYSIVLYKDNLIVVHDDSLTEI